MAVGLGGNMAGCMLLVRRLTGAARRCLAPLAASRSGRLGATLLAAILLAVLAGPLCVPPERQARIDRIHRGPSAAHPLGTDSQGRDNLVMLIYGGREVVALALLTGLLTTLAAVLIGALSALLGGLADRLIMAATDIWLTVPRFIVLVVAASQLRLDSIWALAALLALIGWPGLARQVRAQMLALVGREYIEAARMLDLGLAHIIFRELLPHMLPFLAVAMIGAMTQAVYSQTGLVFLGLVPFGNSWGVMFSLAYAKSALYQPSAAWSLLAPMGAIVLLQLSLIWLARGLETAFNPRLQTWGRG